MGTENPNRANFPLRPAATPFAAPRSAAPFAPSGPMVGAEASALRPTPPVANSYVPPPSFASGPFVGSETSGFRPVPPSRSRCFLLFVLRPNSLDSEYLYMAVQPPPPNLDEYSPSANLVSFDRPIPLLRGPIKAGPSDDPESGPFVLAFKDPLSWASAYKACESHITQQCEAGARIGCSIAASDKCKPLWWKTLLGLAKQDYAERAKCEEREMEACVETAKERCRQFAKHKCSTAFRDARIAVKGLDSKATRREVYKLISWVSLGSKSNEVVKILKFGKSWGEFRSQLEVTSCRGTDVLGSNNVDSIDDYLRNCIQKR